jgi:hypothetical protein
MGCNERLDRHRRCPGDGFDNIVRSSEPSFLKVQCDGAEMLDGLLRQTELLQLAPEVPDPDRVLDHLAAERLAHRFRDAMFIHFDWTEEPIGLAGMWSGVPPRVDSLTQVARIAAITRAWSSAAIGA